mmetsp:Transcript_7440/g.10965  ORF Transcript_7440/g.10965 Transcript_7440/m.10965 type:complete len:87 (+) Transcript_7440:71-331(+)|eukprot:CAMPEP_0202430880 /NCGR_PEP_ID=MMETSP1345-20130828/4181_1 /ASSEMBLY_ACC=CAM_ASM_000843 /TAXON_ID=342563 /ORGANISM="Fabrea Fabrea salina" /LENGTH=86 /DNA_ID=CAMNT_0049042441 /DNA_START=43 /DNA_END=303 /DNA_ORIENTATION=+
MTVLNGPVIYYWSTIPKQKLPERERRVKSYHQVRMKNKEDVQVMTPEAEAVYEQIETGHSPIPLYSTIPSDEEIKKHGLYIIGKDS